MSRALGLIVFFISFGLSAQTNQPKVLHFVTDIFPGLVEDLGHGRVCGLAPYLTKAAAEAIGYGYEMEVLPLPRALKFMKSKAKDGIISIYKTAEREKFLNFTSQPFHVDALQVFSREGETIPWNSKMESLQPYRIGVMQGWYYTDRFKNLNEKDPRYRFEWVPLRESGFKMLRAKRIDVLISNDRILRGFYQSEKRNPDSKPDIVPLEPPLEHKGVYIGFAKSVPLEVVKAFDQALLQLLKDPKIKKVQESPASLCPHSEG
ncbi:MAG TPA: transporter substrate-binding domain-containing protein [Oligoflexus sp.]|uniref:substrate-binding periplasmic protein n=1 Tax=Oligoflexus sp. TaxID=1971216 RepID=UPI002D7FEB09|nr:transporter substrate-binding domain-containing protein [Oligoflexus sp.]HET9239454.1 transporter substrate-binding domain-containing protein [Oligoflexus sp.]